MARDGRFETTHWSVVLAAGGEDSGAARRAFSLLCDDYWTPIRAYVQAHGYDRDEAQDLTQDFFLHLIKGECVQAARQERGRFRSFLLASIRNFMLNDRVHKNALKRGGGQVLVPLEFDPEEHCYVHEPADPQTPETIFQRTWVMTVIQQVTYALQQEAAQRGKAAEFERMKECMMGGSPAGGYKALAAELGVSGSAVKMAVHRLRRDFRELLRATVAQTVATDADIDEEIDELFRLVG